MTDEHKVEDVIHTESIDDNDHILSPDAAALAEPYYAIMALDEEGNTTTQLWGVGDKLMLFHNHGVAEKTLKAIDNPQFAIRGVTKAHLEALKQLVEQDIADIYVMAGITPKGELEALPLDEHDAMKTKAGSPPPLPPKK